MHRGVVLLPLLVGGLAFAQASAPPEAAAPAAPKPAAAVKADGGMDDEEEINLEDIKPEPPAPVLSVGNKQVGASVLGRFDLNYEWINPGNKYPVGYSQLVSYHHFVILVAHAGPVSFDGEITQLLWYEGKAQVSKDFTIVAGKLLVPFGATGWHRYYGGVQGNPLVGIFLPVIWSELGAEVDWNGFNIGNFSLSVNSYVVQGFGAAADGTPNTQVSATTTDLFAPGGRINLSYGDKIHLWLSAYGTKWAPTANWLYLVAADFSTEWGLIDVPVLKDLRLRLGAAYMNWDTPQLQPPQQNLGRLWRYGDYAELDWRTPLQPAYVRLRYGTYIHNARVNQSLDLHNWNLAVVLPLPYGLYTFIEYQWNMEEINEVNNDVLRIGLALDF